MARQTFLVVALAAAAFAACSNEVITPTTTSGTTGVGGAGGGVGGGSSVGGAGGDPVTVGVGGQPDPGPACDADPDEDLDQDGFSILAGDCNDCDPNVNPGAMEVKATQPDENGDIPVPTDEDCNGVIDDIEPSCDAALSTGDTDPLHAAKAIELCRLATPAGKDWGLLSAAWVSANGAPREPGLQAGLLAHFGAKVDPQRGARMLALSTGYARGYPAPDGELCKGTSCSHGTSGPPPDGYPQSPPFSGCPTITEIHDDIALEVKLRAPSNAVGYRFFHKYHSFAFPEAVCAGLNDQFAVIAKPAPLGPLIGGNIAFDSKVNPLSIDAVYLDVCDPATMGSWAKLCAGPSCPPPPQPYCPMGPAELEGTGFGEWGDAGATSWLVAQAPIDPNQEITLRFAIWDGGDDALDSTALVDGFGWLAEWGKVTPGRPPTK